MFEEGRGDGEVGDGETGGKKVKWERSKEGRQISGKRSMYSYHSLASTSSQF